MVLFLEISSGPLAGQKFRARPGLKVGRREGDILLEEDSKVSGTHAQIELDNKGQMVLVDLGSANGLVINGRRVKKVALMQGVVFRVGDTQFGVSAVEDAVAETIEPSKSWFDHVQEALEKVPAENRKIEGAGQAFTPALQLEFIQGIQTDEIITLGYGPRLAGQGHLDIELKELDAPEIAFEIRPGPGSALFRDRSGGRIVINKNLPEADQSLNDGDQISFGGTVIRVRYM